MRVLIYIGHLLEASACKRSQLGLSTLGQNKTTSQICMQHQCPPPTQCTDNLRHKNIMWSHRCNCIAFSACLADVTHKHTIEHNKNHRGT